MAYEYQCKKCKKKVEHYLRITYKCDCGGDFKNIDKPYKLSSYFRYSIFNVARLEEKEAIQELGGRLGVFVKEDESYEFTPLNLGKSDDNLIEVISGIEKGSEYVSKNSYLIKADILKSEAEDND